MRDPNTYRLNIALQWLSEDNSYESLVFKLKVPLLASHTPFVMDTYKAQSWYDYNSDPVYTPDVYLREVILGKFVSSDPPNVDVDTTYTYFDRNYKNFEDGNDERLCIGFAKSEPEPQGYRKLWVAWQFYDESTTCANYRQCLGFYRSKYTGPI